MRLPFLAIAVLIATSLIAAPNQRRYDFDEMRNDLSDMQHELNNHQVEIRVFEEKLSTLDATLEAMREEMLNTKKAQKDKLAFASQDLEARISNIDMTTKGMIADLKAIKTQSNETTSSIGQFKARLGALEKIIEGQNQNIEALQTAMNSMAEAFQIKEGIKPTKTHIVKSGDSLEKIARANQMTIEEVMELNGLTKTKIIVGQKLLVYEK